MRASTETRAFSTGCSTEVCREIRKDIKVNFNLGKIMSVYFSKTKSNSKANLIDCCCLTNDATKVLKRQRSLFGCKYRCFRKIPKSRRCLISLEFPPAAGPWSEWRWWRHDCSSWPSSLATRRPAPSGQPPLNKDNHFVPPSAPVEIRIQALWHVPWPRAKVSTPQNTVTIDNGDTIV